MKKLIRILFLLLLIQFVATACSDNDDCTGTPADGFECIKDSETGDCKEIETCSSTKKESPTKYYCYKLPVYYSGTLQTEQICDLNSDGSCEAKYKCPSFIVNDAGTYCPGFAASFGKKCVKDSDSDLYCTQESISCTSSETVAESDEECAYYKVEDENKYICIKNTGEGLKCKQKELCNTIEKEELTDSVCSQYGISKENKNTHKCIKDPENDKCKEELLLCTEVKKTGTQEIDCSKFPVINSETHICVQNSEGETPCKEEEIPAPTTIHATTISKVIETTSLVKNQTLSEIVSKITSLIKNETTSIDTTQNIITTTSKTETNQTTQTTIPTTKQESNDETSVVFLGCSKFNMAPSNFTFTIHFKPLINELFSKIVTFSLNAIYNNYLKRLEEVNASCKLDESNSQMVNYLCTAQAETANIKQIKFLPKFKFSQGKVTLAGITPLAKISMNNLEEIDDKYSELLSSNPSIYILDNSTFYGYDNYKFNISGIINGEKPTTISVNKILSLMMSLQNSENEEEIAKEANCTVIDIKNDKYTLDCKTADKNRYNLQSTISIIDNEILLVNINDIENYEEEAILDPYKGDDIQSIRYFSKRSKGIGAGAIVGIVLACFVALA